MVVMMMVMVMVWTRRRRRKRRAVTCDIASSWAVLGLLGVFWGALERFGPLVGGALGCLGSSWVHRAPSWRHIGAISGSRGAILAVLDAILGGLEAYWGRLCGRLGRPGAMLEVSWALLGRS